MRQRGFTLIELLVTLAIVGILAAIAIPAFVQYRQRSFDTRAIVDLRNAALAEELHYTSEGEYVQCNVFTCEAQLPGFSLSDGVEIRMVDGGGFFAGWTRHPGGARIGNLDRPRWDSSLGGLQN